MNKKIVRGCGYSNRLVEITKNSGPDEAQHYVALEDVFKPILVSFVDIRTAFAVIITAKANPESHGCFREYISGVSQCYCDLN